MGMLDNLFRDLTKPFREIKSKWMGIQNIKDGLAADAKRLKGYAGDAKKQAGDLKGKAKAAQDKAKGLAEQGKGVAGQAQGAWGAAQEKVGALGGMMPGKPGAGGQPAAGGKPGGPAQGGMPMQGGGGLPPMQGGMPMQPMQGGMPGGGGGFGGMPAGPPQPGQRTMAIMAGGSAGYALGWFVPLKGPQRGELISLKPQSVIGKDPTCEVFINDPFLSGRHATVRAQNGLFVLEDHSTNGTWVNDKKISRHELVDNDFIKVGQTLMKFKAI